MAFLDDLQPASWRGVSFGLLTGGGTYGRRKVRHDYPYRDTVWLEDQGKLPREFRIQGFLVGNSRKYGGGDVLGQLAAMTAAAEAKGQGVLIHPTRGPISVDLMTLTVTERWNEGNYFELEFSFVQGGTQLFPAVLQALGDLIGDVAGLADSAGLGGFVSAVTGPLESGVAAVGALSASASEWAGRIVGLAQDATGLYGTLSALGGDFGRYFNGRNAGFLAGLTSVYSGAASVEDLIVLGSANRAAVTQASNAVATAIVRVGDGGSAADIGTAAQASVDALRLAVADPADGVRILAALATYAPLSPAAKAPAGAALTTVFRQAAATAIARVAAAYQPSSSDDAAAARATVIAPIDAAVEAAGATGDDAGFQAFRQLRSAVVQTLASRGAALPGLVTVETPQPSPALVLANRLYADANRADELVTEADPIHPWFMPTSFRALAA